MRQKLTVIIDEWLEKHFVFVFWLIFSVLLGMGEFFSGIRTSPLYWFAVAVWIGGSVILVVTLYKWIADLAEWKTKMEKTVDDVSKKLDAILERLN